MSEATYTEFIETITNLKEYYPNSRLLLAMENTNSLVAGSKLIADLTDQERKFFVSQPFDGLLSSQVHSLQIDKFDGLFLGISRGGIHGVGKVLKRLTDVVGALFLMFILSPLYIATMLLVLLDRGPLFYRSKRIGLQGRTFNCLKFRTMKVGSEHELREMLRDNPESLLEWKCSYKLKKDPRITKSGSFLRKYSLDELPQLINVLLGDMSLVGPRPILEDEEATYGRNIAGYMLVRPGITGMWQVSGRNSLEYKERIALNAWYIRNWTLWLDFTILLRTIPTVLNPKNSS